ncbi:MAG TPA: PfkB family carbohydrate kinase [Solirubrobacteraceae bacterium]|jgi:sugar/nucleoside kinase (ribokinase family)|nr:PfkB family carbohydrate kinase [Solirubrobacteraceae bacterium]
MSGAGSAPPEGADFVAVGHVTIDMLADGTRRAGGTVLYAAVQAARLGARAVILTRGVPEEIEGALGGLLEEVELVIDAAPETTTLQTTGTGLERRQRVLAWAGPIAPRPLRARVVHLAPVARELASGWDAMHADLVGITAQGLVRRWDGLGDELSSDGGPDAAAVDLASRCDALVVSEQERASGAQLIDAALARGATVAVTAGASPTTVLTAQGAQILPVARRPAPVDDLGAGDVFAAALFLALARGAGSAEAVSFAHAAAAVRVRGVGPGAIGDEAAIAAEL